MLAGTASSSNNLNHETFGFGFGASFPTEGGRRSITGSAAGSMLRSAFD